MSALRLVSLVYFALGILTGVGWGLDYFGNPHPKSGVAGALLPLGLLVFGFFWWSISRRRPSNLGDRK